MNIKTANILIIVLLSVSLLSSISVVGLLQFAEKVNSSGIIVEPSPPPIIPTSPSSNPIIPPPPEPNVKIKIYNDLKCTDLMSNVNWGEIEPGVSVKRKIYVKNAGEQAVTLSLTTEDWTPKSAKDHMKLTWNYDSKPIKVGEVKEITLTLSVDSSIKDIDNFSFEIVIISSV